MDEAGRTGTCNLCGETVPVEDLFEHLRIEHDMDVQPETWPDGGYVIVDETLEPSDFDIGGES